MKLRLKELREGAGWTQQALADKTGIKQSVICDIEKGNVKYPRMDTLVALSHAFNCRIEDMISYRD